MARLPQPGSDVGTWGDILNDFLLQAHNPDGTLKAASVGDSQLQTGSIVETKLSSAVQAKLNQPASIADGSITKAKLESAVQTSLDMADTSVQTVNNKTPTAGAVTLNAADVGALTQASADARYLIGLKQASAPSNPSANDLWYDTSTDLLKRYNGTSWVEGSGSSNAVAGQELAYTEVRSGINASSTSVNTGAELGAYLSVIVPPCSRPYLVTASAILGHTTLGAVVGLRIIEVSNGVDSILARSEIQEVPGPSGTPPYYATVKPELRVPPSVRTRTFKIQYFQMAAGTVTVYVPGTTTGIGQSGEWQLFIRAVAQ